MPCNSLVFGVFRYTYGKGVNGIAYVRFGLIDEKGNKIYLQGTEQQIAVSKSFCIGKKAKMFLIIKKKKKIQCTCQYLIWFIGLYSSVMQVEDGTANTHVLTEDLKTASENNTQGHIEGYYLYIAVSVLEKASE